MTRLVLKFSLCYAEECAVISLRQRSEKLAITNDKLQYLGSLTIQSIKQKALGSLAMDISFSVTIMQAMLKRLEMKSFQRLKAGLRNGVIFDYRNQNKSSSHLVR